MIPLGGYVKIKGFESIFRNLKDTNNEHDSFQSLHLFKKICIFEKKLCFILKVKKC